MSHHVFHFFSSFEGTVTSEETVDFPRPTAEITITNDDTKDILCFKFDGAEEYATVYPNETITIRMDADNIIINGMGNPIAYRIWCFT